MALNKKEYKLSGKDGAYKEYQRIIAELSEKLAEFQDLIQRAGNLKNITLETLNPILVNAKNLNDDLLKIESEVAHSEIKLFSQKCEAIFKRIEPKLFALNEISKKLPVGTNRL